MLKWSTALKYQPYEQWSTTYINNLEKTIAESSDRLSWHIQPPTGLLNDPNGFCYFNHQWHLFYQYYPYGPVHGLKSWYHVTSTDLVHWHNQGIALYPDTQFDSHGVYSGSALPLNDHQLLLMYTGNVRDAHQQRHSYQNLALMDTQQQVTKPLTNPVIKRPNNVTAHFRDPQIIKRNNDYFALIGAQNKTNLRGEINLFKSSNLTDWENLGFLKLSYSDLGYMIECPNLIMIDRQPVLIFCPQGLPQDVLAYDNNYPNTYLIGQQLDWDHGRFESGTADLHLLDQGFDCYATQVLAAPDGRALAVSWVGLPDTTYPTDCEGWSNCLSMVKELHIKNGRLRQQPVTELTQLRHHHHHETATITTTSYHGSRSYELKLAIAAGQQGQLKLMADQATAAGLRLDFDTRHGQLQVQRHGLQTPTEIETRQISLATAQALTLDIFVDHSLIEIFVNDGEYVFTQRIFAPLENTWIKLETPEKLTYNSDYWDLKSK